jgi:beta-glucosidase
MLRFSTLPIFLFTTFAQGGAMANELEFPPNFQWCVATAGHQIEGDNINSDWWDWEQLPGTIRKGEKSGKAAYHMDRLEEDIKIMQDLGVKTYRFSIEWSRIEPRQGFFDEKAVEYYKREIALLKQAGIAPFVTIHHFVQPQWFTGSGGWKRVDSPDLFLKYVEKVEKEFGGEVDQWVTFNEPMVLLMGGYIVGMMPPGETDLDVWDPLVNIMKSHGRAYHYLHKKADERGKKIKVGLAHHLRPLVGSNWLMQKILNLPDYFINWNIPTALKTGKLVGFGKKKLAIGFRVLKYKQIILEEVKGTQDFFGVNYYTREYITLTKKKPFINRTPLPGLVGTDYLNWGLDPEGFFEVLKKSHELYPHLPFIITENGLTDPSDQHRAKYIVNHLRELHRAMTELNHQVDGYCYWSLLDNFEWQEGFDPRFGLFEVDYANGGARKARPSVEVVRKIFKTNRVEVL